MKQIASKPIRNNHKHVTHSRTSVTHKHSQHNPARFRFRPFIRHWSLLPVLMFYGFIKWHSHSHSNGFGGQNLHLMNAHLDQLCHSTNIRFQQSSGSMSDCSKRDPTRMWANAQPDGRPAEHRWRPLFNAPKFG